MSQLRPVLLVPFGSKEVPRLKKALSGEGLRITVARDGRAARRLLEESAFDEVVISEPPCRLDRPSNVDALIRLAERRRIPVSFLPADPGPVLPRPRNAARRDGKRSRRLDLGRLKKVFEKSVRPAFLERGGDVKLVRVTGGKVIVRFLGVCGGCDKAQGNDAD